MSMEGENKEITGRRRDFSSHASKEKLLGRWHASCISTLPSLARDFKTRLKATVLDKVRYVRRHPIEPEHNYA
jgi:hypothetical protein